MAFELLVGALLLYGLAGLVIAALGASGTRNVLHHDAPIFVTRRNGHATTSTVSTRAGLTRSATHA